MRFSLVQLETFYWVARLGRFHAAARRLNLTQPTISLRIKELETALGIALFDRSGHRAKPTLASGEALAYAERILTLAEEMETQVKTRDRLHGLLRLGAADTFALTCLPELLVNLDHNHPEMQVELTVAYSTNLSRQLNDGELDVAFLTGPQVDAHVAAEPLGYIDLAWVASPHLRLPNKILVPADLAHQQIITNPQPSHLYTSITQWFAAMGAEPERISTCNSLTILTKLTVAGSGVSMLPPSILEAELESGELCVLRTRPAIAPHEMFVAHQLDGAEPGIHEVMAIARDVLARSMLLRRST
jgi:DNA-binding transcriptional LysR family regulator